ncbi:universal stress protein, partial [Nitrosomonas supralitoralis]
MQRFNNILCVVSPDPTDCVVLKRAVALAENNQARLTVVDVINELPRNTNLIGHAQPLKELRALIVAERRQGLENRVAPWRKKIEIQTNVFIGIPFLEIIYEILRNGHDLVIKTAEKCGLLDRMFGSDDMHLLRKCPCPVWLVKPESPKKYQRILAAVDVDDYYPPEELEERYLLNLQILELASSLALSEFAELHVVHAWEAVAENLLRGAFRDTSEYDIIAYIEALTQQYKQNL